MHRIIDYQLSISVNTDDLPETPLLDDWLAIGISTNAQFVGMPRCPFALARRVARFERDAIANAPDDLGPSWIEHAELEIQRFLPRGGPRLDLGTAGMTLALSVAGAYPTSSCNAGVFGDRAHYEIHPLVAFFCTKRTYRSLEALARRFQLGLYEDDDGHLVVFANDVATFPAAALALLKGV